MNADSLDERDLLVVGGGFAGTLCALTAARLNLQVRLLRKPREHVFRGECTSPETAELLRQLLQSNLSDILRPLDGRSWLWDRPTRQERDGFLHYRGGHLMVDVPRLDSVALNRARFFGVDVVNATVHAIQPSKTGWKLDTDVGSFRSGIVVDATGSAGVLTSMAGRQRVRLDHLFATVGSIRGRAAHYHNWLVVEAGPDGWWYRTPDLGEGIVVGRLAEDQALLDHNKWLGQLRSTLVVGPGLPMGRWQLKFYDASSHAMLDAPAGLLPIGAAAIARDPLSGQGLEHSVTDAVAASRLIASGRSPRQCQKLWKDRTLYDWITYKQQRAETYSAPTRWAHHQFWHARCALA